MINIDKIKKTLFSQVYSFVKPEYYEVLGVPRYATNYQIDQVYKFTLDAIISSSTNDFENNSNIDELIDAYIHIKHPILKSKRNALMKRTEDDVIKSYLDLIEHKICSSIDSIDASLNQIQNTFDKINNQFSQWDFERKSRSLPNKPEIFH